MKRGWLKYGLIPLLIGALLAAFLFIPIVKTSALTANPIRDLPDQVERGQSFNVTITFTAPQDDFNSIGLTDIVPAGWTIEADASECTPAANAVKVTPEENKVEIVWYGPYSAGQSFTAVYHVTVPSDAELDTYEFPDGTLLYYIAGDGPFTEDVGGDSQIEVCAPILAVNPDPPDHDFGDANIGESLSWSFEITNAGCGTLSWTVSTDVDWISVDPASGTTTTETDTVTVMVDTSSLVCSCTIYEGHITVQAGDQEKTGTIKVHPVLPVTRELPDTGVIGSYFDVEITFKAPADEFNSIGLTDFAPAGWTVEADAAWCTPQANAVNTQDNKVEIAWYGPFTKDTSFTAVYRVYIPSGTTEGFYNFGSGTLLYYIGQTECHADVTGEDQIEAVSGTPVCGTTGEVKCDILSGVTVTVYDEQENIVAEATSDEDGYYELAIPQIGTFNVVAHKDGFRDETQDLTIEGLGPDYAVTLDFRGETGLVPNAPSMDYALACVNHWLYPPDGCGLTMAKALSVVNAWLYPIT